MFGKKGLEFCKFRSGLKPDCARNILLLLLLLLRNEKTIVEIDSLYLTNKLQLMIT